MPGELKTEDLVAKLAQGDERAFGALYDRLSPLLLGVATRILSSPELVDESIEEVFLNLWNRATTRPRPEGSVEFQLALAARNSAVRRLRKARGLAPTVALNGDYLADEELLPAIREIELINSREELVRGLLNQLPAAQLRVLDLAIFDGYSEKEVASLLGEPLGRVRDELRACLAFARQRIKTLVGRWTADI